MNHDQLLILDAIITTGSFNAASELLHRSQPSLSMSIKKLEEELNVKIFSRDQYRATLTREGEAIYKKVKIILRHSEDLFALSKQLSIGREPEIWLVIDSLFPLPLILGSLKQFIETYPETEFNLSVEYLNGAIEQIQGNEADLAITPVDESNSQLTSIPILDVSLIPVASPNFPPALKREELHVEDLEPFIQILAKDSGHRFSKKMVPLYPKNTKRFIDGGRHWTVNNNTTKKQFIIEGLGWGRLPSYEILDELLTGKLVPLNIQGIKPVKVKQHLVRNVNRPIGPITHILWEKMLEWSQGIINHEKQIDEILKSCITPSPHRFSSE